MRYPDAWIIRSAIWRRAGSWLAERISITRAPIGRNTILVQLESFKSAEARSSGEAGKPWARTDPSRRNGEPVHHESTDRALVACVSTMRISAARSPEPETSGGEWKDLQCDADLSPAVLLSSKSSLPQRNAATPFEITHPYHPLRGQKFKLVTYRHNWGEDRVYFHNAEGRLSSTPACWTTVVAPDPFVAVEGCRLPSKPPGSSCYQLSTETESNR
jgi:hypothetical protein